MLPELPIDTIRPQLDQAIASGNNFALSAPTGSGKSTRVPQFIHQCIRSSGKQVVVLEPRRMAARLLARRVAHECQSRLGDLVGYQIRHESVLSSETRILFVTEGTLLRQIQSDRNLASIGAILFDEFHERHLYSDITLALTSRLKATSRQDLTIGVMSATLEVEQVASFLDPCIRIKSDGRTFPIDITHVRSTDVPDQQPVWESAAKTFRAEARKGFDGSCLIFMPGAYEIRRTIDAISALPESRPYSLHMLHGEQTPDQQDEAVSDDERPRVIVATNVAETSITLPGVRLVIDSGQARIAGFDPRREINTLLVEKISRASADQRAGRAGRTAPGRCVRLWPLSDHERRTPHLEPEIQRLELSEILLQLACMGHNLSEPFDWFEAPPSSHLERGVELLKNLGAIGSDGAITGTGRKMAAFPLHPRYARILLAADAEGSLGTACLLVAVLEGRSLLTPLRDKSQQNMRTRLLEAGNLPIESDILAELQAWQFAREQRFHPDWGKKNGIHTLAARQAAEASQQLLGIARKCGLGQEERPTTVEMLHRLILAGFSDHVAMRLNAQNYAVETARGRRGEISRHSLSRDHKLIVATAIEERTTGKDVTVLLSQAAPIKVDWLRELFPEDIATRRRTYFDVSSRRAVTVEETVFRQLALEKKELPSPDADQAAVCLAEEIIAGRLVLKQWNEAVEQWICRINCLATTASDLGFTPFAEEDRRMVIEQICLGKSSYREVKDCAVASELESWLDPILLPLVDRMAPARLELSNGFRGRIRYQPDGSALISAPIQKLFDIPQRELVILDGRLNLKVELLAPNQRPVQITENLDGFWEGSYPAIKKELKGRYPKHEWR